MQNNAYNREKKLGLKPHDAATPHPKGKAPLQPGEVMGQLSVTRHLLVEELQQLADKGFRPDPLWDRVVGPESLPTIGDEANLFEEG